MKILYYMLNFNNINQTVPNLEWTKGFLYGSGLLRRLLATHALDGVVFCYSGLCFNTNFLL